MDLTRLPLDAVWQPDGKTPEKGPVLIVLHGRGDSTEGFTWMKDELDIPGLSLLLLNAPDPYYGGYSWYDLPPDQLPGILRSRRLLEAVMEELVQQGFDLSRCFLFGFSQGCLMTLEFGGRYSRKLAGYIGVSGYVFDWERLLQEANPEVMNGEWLVTHGAHDDVLPVETTREQIRQLKEGGFKIEYREYRKVHTIDPKDELPLIREWINARI